MAANDNAIICGADFTLEELLIACIGQTADGKNYIRTYSASGVAGSKAAICASSVEKQDVDAILKSVFTLNAAGDYCVRLSTT